MPGTDAISEILCQLRLHDSKAMALEQQQKDCLEHMAVIIKNAAMLESQRESLKKTDAAILVLQNRVETTDLALAQMSVKMATGQKMLLWLWGTIGSIVTAGVLLYIKSSMPL